MSDLTNPSAYELSEIQALRDRRNSLLRQANKLRHRRNRSRDLQQELQQATNELLKHELADRQTPVPQPDRCIEPMGDAGAVGGSQQERLPYKDN